MIEVGFCGEGDGLVFAAEVALECIDKMEVGVEFGFKC